MGSRIVTTLLGIWLMAAPDVLDFGKRISDSAHIVGPLIAAFSIIAMWECTRNVRYANVLLAVWLLVAPWVLQYNNETALWNDYIIAALLIVFSLLKAKRKNRFGGGWPAIWRSNTSHAREAANPDRIHVR